MSLHRLSRRQILAGSTAVVASSFLLLQDGWAASSPTSTRPVEISSGRIRGQRMNGVSVFRGIHYGGDTAAHRFQAPAPPTPISGVLDAFTLGPQAPQMDSALSNGVDLTRPLVQAVIAAGRQGMEVGNESEDCLVLNVFTPDASPVRRRPVMVWLHGGGFAIGSGGDPQYDGQALARQGDVVVVTINHRLNAFGYLYLGALHDDFLDSGNAGMLDIVQALHWVRDNIAQFGGDAGNVTIFGESGGGSKVSTLLAMPPARGLFHKAIIQSGPGIRMESRQDAADHATRTLAALNVAPADVHRLQTMERRQITDAAVAAIRSAGRRGGRLLSPVVDGRSLPTNPFDPAAPDTARGVALMIGTCATEATLFLSADPLFGQMDEAQARQRATAMAGPAGGPAIDLYKRLHPTDQPTYWLTAMATDRGTWMDSIRLAERKVAQNSGQVYMFRLDWRTPMMGGVMRTPHGLDVPLVFNNVASRPLLVGAGRDPQVVANRMSKAWTNFAHSGNPSQAGLPWSPYDPHTRETMIFNVTSRQVSDPDGEARRFWVDHPAAA